MKRLASIACITFVVLLFGCGIASAQSTYPGDGPARGYGWRTAQAAGLTQTGAAWQCPRGGNCPGPQWGKYGNAGGPHGLGRHGRNGTRPCWRVR